MANNINEINTSLVLQKLWLSPGLSRTEIARILGLGKATVTKIVGDLLSRNLVTVAERGRSGPTGGRSPVHLAINADYGCVLGLELQTECCKAVAVNLRGDVILSWTKALVFGNNDIVETFLGVMRELGPRVDELAQPLIGVGVGLAGIIDAAEGIITQSNPLAIREPVSFRTLVQDTVRVPVLVENDANSCCWGELAFRKTHRHRNFAFVLGEFRRGRTTGNPEYWGIAVGLGFVLNGRVYRGDGFSAGEFQSILWEPTNQGQLSLGDEESRRIATDPQVFSRALRELSAHVAFLVNTLNLECVVIGGEIARYRDEITTVLNDEIQKNWSYPNPVSCSIEFATLGDMAVAYGAAGMFLEHFFSIPEPPDNLTPRGGGRVRDLATGQRMERTAAGAS